jgi:hypothetical protein
MRIYGRYALSIGAAAALLAGCGGSQPPIRAAGEMPQALIRSANGDAHKRASYLYMAQCCRRLFSNHGNITVYERQLTGVALTITKGVFNPSFITVDRTGRVYMMSLLDSGQGVIEYDAGSKRPSRRIKTPYVVVAATDDSNNLYAAVCPECHEYISGKGSINVYEAGTTKLLRVINHGIYSPSALAFDTDGNLYVLNRRKYGAKTAVLVYAPGASKPSRSLPQPYTDISAIALDPSNHLFVVRSPISGASSVVEYKAASKHILRTITNGVQSPQAIAFDSSGTLYVSNAPYSSLGWVSVYAPGDSAPSYRITSGINDPQLLAVDAEGNLYVGNDDYGSSNSDLCVYAPKAEDPLRCVSYEQYNSPYSLAVRPR